MWNLYYLSRNIKIVECGATTLMMQLCTGVWPDAGLRNISKYRGSKGRHDLSVSGDQIWELFDWWNQCLECYKKEVIP